MTPLTILIVGSFFIGLSATSNPDSTLAVVASLLPFSSPLVMPTRIALGEAATGRWWPRSRSRWPRPRR